MSHGQPAAAPDDLLLGTQGWCCAQRPHRRRHHGRAVVATATGRCGCGHRQAVLPAPPLHHHHLTPTLPARLGCDYHGQAMPAPQVRRGPPRVTQPRPNHQCQCQCQCRRRPPWQVRWSAWRTLHPPCGTWPMMCQPTRGRPPPATPSTRTHAHAHARTHTHTHAHALFHTPTTNNQQPKVSTQTTQRASHHCRFHPSIPPQACMHAMHGQAGRQAGNAHTLPTCLHPTPHTCHTCASHAWLARVHTCNTLPAATRVVHTHAHMTCHT